MATVKKCDICGAVYDKYQPEANMNIYVQEGLKSEHIAVAREETNCCPECTTSILGFINVMKNTNLHNR